jgi:hypothetical protein
VVTTIAIAPAQEKSDHPAHRVFGLLHAYGSEPQLRFGVLCASLPVFGGFFGCAQSLA